MRDHDRQTGDHAADHDELGRGRHAPKVKIRGPVAVHQRDHESVPDIDSERDCCQIARQPIVEQFTRGEYV